MQFIWEFYFEILLNDQRMKINRQNPWICFASSAEEEVLGEQRRGVCALMCVCVCVCVWQGDISECVWPGEMQRTEAGVPCFHFQPDGKSIERGRTQ